MNPETTMLHMVATLANVILAGYLIWEIAKFGGEYEQLKQDIAGGDEQARSRFYVRLLKFEWASALLALLGLDFDKTKLTAAALDIGGTRLGRLLSSSRAADNGMVAGVAVGLVIGLIAMIVVRLRVRIRGTPQAADARSSALRKLMPDFTALIPVTGRERLLFSGVAVSAGICEEIVFRGWLLFTLHNTVGLGGAALVLIAAAIFGLAHVYQGATGVIATAAVGLFLCGVYVLMGTLLVPIVLHSFMDLRLAILPASPRTPPWLASGWGCRGRRLSRG